MRILLLVLTLITSFTCQADYRLRMDYHVLLCNSEEAIKAVHTAQIKANVMAIPKLIDDRDCVEAKRDLILRPEMSINRLYVYAVPVENGHERWDRPFWILSYHMVKESDEPRWEIDAADSPETVADMWFE